MKRTVFGAMSLVLMASVAVAADARALRMSLQATAAPVVLGQPVEIPMPPPLSPTPDPAYSQGYQPSAPYSTIPQYPVQSPGMIDQGYGIPNGGYPATALPVELFPNVKYRATRNIAPCAVPTIVQVADPCNKDRCCKSCVNVQICVPPCDPSKIKVTRNGNKVRYDYGKYAVAITTIGDRVVVHYGD